jgi:hypothetical protein
MVVPLCGRTVGRAWPGLVLVLTFAGVTPSARGHPVSPAGDPASWPPRGGSEPEQGAERRFKGQLGLAGI